MSGERLFKRECGNSRSGKHIWTALRVSRRDESGAVVEAIKSCRYCPALWVGQSLPTGQWIAKINFETLVSHDIAKDTGEIGTPAPKT